MEWISVKDRLPIIDRNIPYLVTDDFHNYQIGYWDEREKCFYDDYVYKLDASHYIDIRKYANNNSNIPK